ncbi:ecto-ADP-ribosyltransferase 5-like [Narcine bancroftii]|uniref:ecto-ADP-ribosyltransferase 5-like n=1 Tax=Narcine bancroftii TaxID=1343680 RepID=UPI0038314CF5
MRSLGSFLIFTLSCYQSNALFQTSELDLCHVAEKQDNIQMDMAVNSADYHFVHSTESDRIAIDYIQEEKNHSTFFSDAWLKASQEWKNKKSEVIISEGMLDEHFIAILCYTLDSPPLYRYFNQAIRNYGVNDEMYAKCFPYKSLHYLLSVALSILKSSAWQPGPRAQVYRGIDKKVQVSEGAHVRFGQFASTSLNMYQSVSTFTKKGTGTSTLFNITTAHGVSIEKISFFRSEEEVLIPPYEVFNVTKIVDWKGENGLLGVNIVLSSIGTRQREVELQSDGPGHLKLVRVLVPASFWWVFILTILLVLLLLAAGIMLVKKWKSIAGSCTI